MMGTTKIEEEYDWIDRYSIKDIYSYRVAFIFLNVYFIALLLIYPVTTDGRISPYDILGIVIMYIFLYIFIMIVSTTLIIPRIKNGLVILPYAPWYNPFSKKVFNINDIDKIYIHGHQIEKIVLKNGEVIDFRKVKVDPLAIKDLKEYLFRKLNKKTYRE